jgi:hypothetical protein
MSALRQLVRALAGALAARDPGSVHRAVALGELRRHVLPYRRFRDALGLVSLDDYELLVLRLCAEEEGWVRTAPVDVAERCRAELAKPYPDLELLDGFEAATIQLGAAALARAREGDLAVDAPAGPGGPDPRIEPARAGDEPPAAEPDPQPEPLPHPPVREPDPLPVMEPDPPAVMEPDPPPVAEPDPVTAPPGPPPAARCRFCAGSLPGGREIIFCPFCGRQLRQARCGRCGAEVEAGWRHCVTCGHPVPGGVTV